MNDFSTLLRFYFCDNNNLQYCKDNVIDKIYNLPGGKLFLEKLYNLYKNVGNENGKYVGVVIIKDKANNPYDGELYNRIIEDYSNNNCVLIFYYSDKLFPLEKSIHYKELCSISSKFGSDNLRVVFSDHIINNEVKDKIPFKFYSTLCLADTTVQRSITKHLLPIFNNQLNFKRQKHFLFLNGSAHKHRIDFAYKMHKKNLLKYCDWSFNDFYGEIDQWKGVYWDEYESVDFFKLLPKNIDKLNRYSGSGGDINLSLYFNSYFDIVSFSHFDFIDDEEYKFVFLCEKIWKTIISFKPFIIIAPSNTLKVLNRLGFETFPEVVDENYDNIESDTERLNTILNEVKKLSEKSLEEMDEIFKEVKGKLINNHKKLINNIHYFDDNIYGELTKWINNI